MEELAKYIAGVIALALLLTFIPVIGKWIGAIVLLAGIAFLVYAIFNA